MAHAGPTDDTIPGAYPVCLPKFPYLNRVVDVIPSGINTTYTHYAVWICEMKYGYFTQVTLFTPAPDVASTVIAYVNGKWTLTQAQADCKVTCSTPTADEESYIETLLAKYRPHAVVAFNGASATRNVYAANGLALNPTPVAGSTVAVGTTCNENSRLAGTPYYSVYGQPNAQGGTLGDVYAVCTVSLPIGAN